ncbi:MAG: bifunctional chorismate mutase/prephenate dehydratase [Chloroflexi bacterium]|nr:bifunctional chorismate mutase/prephenate dehydratase [Chloroflexota bacterium]
MRVAYQGIPGAFSEAAALALLPPGELAAHDTFAEVFASLEGRKVEAAVVPVENSEAGAVADVYDLLTRHRAVTIVAEAMLRVRHHLLGVPGSRPENVRAARSHPQALAQVEAYLRERSIRPVVSFDTAGAAAEVAELGDPSIAAVASARAAERYGLVVLERSIETAPDNMTRFFVLAPNGDRSVRERIPAALRSGPAKTSLAYVTLNVPGALVRSLQPFATAGIQLTKIESRPSRAAPWDYVFYLDFAGDPAVSPATEALALMRTCCDWVHLLGTYPAATTVIEPS